MEREMRWIVACLLFVSVSGLSESLAQPFSETAWKEIGPIYQAIREHPFNVRLEAGTLSPKVFDYYLNQDSLYLSEFAKVLSVLANKLDKSADIKRVLQSAIHCLEEEKKEVPKGLTLAPAAFSYTNYLLATAAYKSREELVAALLPCFWIYLRLAQGMKLEKGNPYQSWIDTYRSQKYQESVEGMIRLTNELAERSSVEERTRMLAAFVTASRLEWYFWEGAYGMETWRPN